MQNSEGVVFHFRYEIILSSLYCELRGHEAVQELMGRLQITDTFCKYKEYDTRLKEQFINGLDNKNIIEEVIKELTSLRDTGECEQHVSIDVGPEN